MTEMITWIQTYDKEIFTGVFFGLQGMLLLLLLVNGHRIKKIRKRMNQIAKQTEEYLNRAQINKEKVSVTAAGMEPVQNNAGKDKPAKKTAEEEENGLITAVLTEIFP